MSTNRETARNALVTLLTASLVGTGLPAKTVTGSKVDTLQDVMPLVAVLSSGTLRETQPINRATFYFEVQVWMRQAIGDWTNALAEDALDEIESLISATYDDARNTTEWQIVQYDAQTTVIELTAEGVSYYMERIPTVVRLAKA